MNVNKGLLAAAGVLALMSSGVASAQSLQYGDFETVSPGDASQPLGWNPFNGAIRRTVGDGLLPTLPSTHGGVAAVEETPRSIGPSDFIGYSSDSLQDPNDANSPRNNPGYTFNPPSGPDLHFGAWFMIPATDPITHQRAGMKLEFRRTENNSVYEGFDYLVIDPANPSAVPGLVAVNTPQGPGVHTNGQWVQLSFTFHQSQFTIPEWPLPPVNPDAKVSILAIRYGDPYVVGARGTIFFDDISFSQANACPADFNNSGAVTVQDIFDFLAAYFSNGPGSDFNNSGATTVQDIFDFLSAYFTGCPV